MEKVQRLNGNGLEGLKKSSDGSRYSLVPPVMVFICSIIMADNEYIMLRIIKGLNKISTWFVLDNQEDSLILNKSSVERGMFVTTAYRTLVYEEKKKTNCSFEKIEIPPLKSQNKTMNYSKLGQDGIVMKGLPVYKGDIIVGKTLTKVQKEDKEEKMDCSLSISSGEEGIVDEIWTDMNEEGYFMVKIKIRQLRIPEVGDKLACFTDKTSVLTDKGWKSIKDVLKEDKVATLQHGEIVYDFPLETFEYDYEGKMYHLVSQQLDMTVTPNHKLYVKRRDKKEYELIKAEDVFGKRVSHQKNGEWKKEDQQYLEIENFGKVNVKAWCYFLGIWYAEGWATRKSVNSGVVSISVNKKRVFDKLEDVLTYLNIPFKYNENEEKIHIYNQSLFHHLAVNKTLPGYVWNFSKEESRCLLEGLLLGDGSKCQNSISWSYWTSSFKLAEDVQKLALHCGYSSNMILPEGRKAGSINIMKDGRAIQTTADNYRVAIITTKNNPTVNHGHIQVEEWIDYKGKVYCIEVPEHIIYVKQNGKPYWSGNSRSSQKGVCGLLLEQENMPFTSQGITPDLIMNPHCFTKETLVTLCNGLSKCISDMSVSGGEDVWCHDKKSGITMSKNLSMGCGGVKPIVKLTFEDGRTIRCTHGHQFYTSDGKWVEAQNIELGKDKIQMSLEGVFDEIEEEKIDWLFFNDREKTLAFARILGYTLADGCICKSNGSFSCPVSFGHDIDAELCKKDILLLTGKSPKILTNNSSIGSGFVYIVNLPCELVKLIVNLDGITIGRRTQQETTWPSFLFTSPKSVVREFLAGLFGGDGHAPYLRGEHVLEIRFSQTTSRKYEDHFTQKMQSLCDLLNLFHVDACIERKRYYHKSSYKECSLEDMKEDTEYMTSIYIIVKDTLAFSQNIGMRYCIEKMSRLSLCKSYKLLQKRVKKQSEDIFALVDFYNKKGNTLQKSLSLAREEYFKTNISLNEYYTFGISGKTQLGNRRKEHRSSDVLHLNYKYFPTFKKYIENLGCLHWYSSKEYAIDREASVLPTFNMKVVGRVDDGEEPIYCFNVKDFNNFIAEGTVVSNSLPSRMTLSQLIECLYSKVGSLDGTFGDSTAFTEQSINPVEDIAKKLQSFGFQRYGNERMYNGFTGEMIDSDIFIGPTYYQRLKHLVADKIHCLTPDHDVLTISGWKKILDVTLEDKVATLNKNGELEYDNPLNIMNYPDYEGSMYYIKNQSIDLAVTGNHRMWVSKRENDIWLPFDFERADQLLGKIVKYKKDAKWIKDDYLIDMNEYKFSENLPKWVFKLSRSQTLVLLSKLKEKGLGSEDEIQHLSLHAGLHEYIHSDTEETFIENEKCHVVCLEVPNQIFYVRRNGKAVWTGNSRATGNVTMMHHQPSEGRSREGGLRVGEMERDALISHGGAAFIQETLFDMSDEYQVNVCETCGNILSTPNSCRICKNGLVNRTNIPYCAKLLFQELEAMGIKIQIHTK